MYHDAAGASDRMAAPVHVNYSRIIHTSARRRVVWLVFDVTTVGAICSQIAARTKNLFLQSCRGRHIGPP